MAAKPKLPASLSRKSLAKDLVELTVANAHLKAKAATDAQLITQLRQDLKNFQAHWKQEVEDVSLRLGAELKELAAKVGVPIRRHMPDTRSGLNHKFDVGGQKGYLNVGLFPDGTPGEIFIEIQKEGSTLGGLMDTVAILTSVALQYGVPLARLVEKFSYQRYEPSGTTPNPDIRYAYSITDYIFRWMGSKFIKGFKPAKDPHSDSQL